ncbi:N-acetyltransferase [Wenzhouxiangella sp. XN79A]|uniref:GNAT family N-acetyltransferase n=1 Tax=Wenzhouxiangella sp. XN79A TaxID=2724193 RepID=UPI00144AC6EB|nr:GNAT family N-acetyltransferase [Wenzhouxiangella sp. XN79A]NKI36144.1 N-acetyltransferase [Wenzhouxiangella sp. XN79A]
MSDPVVRPVEDRDFGAIQAIYAEAVLNGSASFELEPPTVEEMRGRQARLSERGYPYLVAELDARVAGFCYAGSFRGRPAYRRTVENSVYVAREFQRRGVGRALLDRLIRECESRGFRQMIAVIGGQRNAASVRLHERVGFERVGVLRDVGWKFDAWQDVTLMQKRLGAAESPIVR